MHIFRHLLLTFLSSVCIMIGAILTLQCVEVDQHGGLDEPLALYEFRR